MVQKSKCNLKLPEQAQQTEKVTEAVRLRTRVQSFNVPAMKHTCPTYSRITWC